MDFEWFEDKDNNFSEDRLGRAKIAKFLTNYLIAEGTKRNYVLNVNAEWGAGKTYFLKRWQHSIQNDHPVVYIDAWQQDYSDDPLLTVVSSIISQLQGQHGSPGDVTIHKASRGLLGLFKVSAPFVAKAVVKKVSGIEFDELTEELKEEGAFDMAASEVAGKVVAGLLEDHASKKKAIDDFKIAIKAWATRIEETTTLKSPVFIFIDELDRCRPTYAIEMLEVIKHLFDIEGVVFVVATDTQQLQHAIKVIYGERFDASTYLGRFFNRRVTLKCGEIRDYVQNLPQFESLKTLIIDKEGYWPGKLLLDDLLEQTCAPMENYRLDLRTTDRIIDRLLAILNHTNNKSLQIDILFLTTLLCMNEKDHDLYEDISSKRIKSKGLTAMMRSGTNEPPKFTKTLTLNINFWSDIGGNINGNGSTPRLKPISFTNHFSHRLTHLENPEEQENALRKNQSSIGNNTSLKLDLLLPLSYIYTAPARHLATWQDYINWVELASSFDE